MMRPLPLAFAALPAPLEVILLVCINSPMYLNLVSNVALPEIAMTETHDWRKRLPPSSFSCSFLTTSTRSTISMRLACSCLACLGVVVSWMSNGREKTGAAELKQCPAMTSARAQRATSCRVPVATHADAKGSRWVGTHSIKACRASWPIFSISSLLRRGLMVLASPSSYSSSLSSMLGLSRGIMMVPLDLRLPRRGRGCSDGSPLAWSCSLTEEPEEVVDMSSGYEGRRESCSTADG